MKNPLISFISAMPLGARVLLLLYAIGFPIAMAGHYSQAYDLYKPLCLYAPGVWKGELWRCFTYTFLAAGVIDWVVSLFWLATLFSVLGRNWTSLEVVGFCLLSTVAGALIFVVVAPRSPMGIVSCPAMIFAMLAAWYRLYGRERLILLGVGEISVRQAAILVALIELLIFGFCLGILGTLAMIAGGAVGWVYLQVRGKTALNRRSQVVDSRRIARLEL